MYLRCLVRVDRRSTKGEPVFTDVPALTDEVLRERSTRAPDCP